MLELFIDVYLTKNHRRDTYGMTGDFRFDNKNQRKDEDFVIEEARGKFYVSSKTLPDLIPEAISRLKKISGTDKISFLRLQNCNKMAEDEVEDLLNCLRENHRKGIIENYAYLGKERTC